MGNNLKPDGEYVQAIILPLGLRSSKAGRFPNHPRLFSFNFHDGSASRDQSIKIEFSLYLFPRHTRFAGVALNRGAEFYDIFPVFETFLETAHRHSH
jgi:hypothetical protein